MLGFRVWDSKEKQMISARDTDYSFYMRDNGKCYYDAGGYGPCENLIEFDSRFIPMQSTGLFDKNGKEIFEEDIIKFIDGNETIIEDVRDFLICLHPSDAGKEKYHLSCEIIGNKYEKNS